MRNPWVVSAGSALSGSVEKRRPDGEKGSKCLLRIENRAAQSKGIRDAQVANS